MARFKLTVDLYVEADSVPRAMDAAVAWIQNQGPNPCSDWRAVGTPLAVDAVVERELTDTEWVEGPDPCATASGERPPETYEEYRRRYEDTYPFDYSHFDE